MKTIRVRMRTTAAGHLGVLHAGMTYELEPVSAFSLANGGYAELVEPETARDEPVAEAAVDVPVAETAVPKVATERRNPRRRGRQRKA